MATTVAEVEEASNMETLVERCAGLDVHKDSVTACVRVPNGHGGRQLETRRFTTTTAGLVQLGVWLASFEVTRVGMESTGCYWKPWPMARSRAHRLTTGPWKSAPRS